MISVALSIALTLLVIINTVVSIKYLSMRKKYFKQKQETQMFKNLFNEANRKVKEEANKNIILQSLINQKTKV